MVAIEMKLTPEQPLWLADEYRQPGSVDSHDRKGPRSHKWHPPTDVTKQRLLSLSGSS